MYKKMFLLILFLLLLNLGYGDLAESIDSLKLKIKEDSTNYLLHLQLGMCYYSLKEFESALNEFNRVLELDPSNSQAEMKIATTYYRMDSLGITRLSAGSDKKADYPDFSF